MSPGAESWHSDVSEMCRSPSLTQVPSPRLAQRLTQGHSQPGSPQQQRCHIPRPSSTGLLLAPVSIQADIFSISREKNTWWITSSLQETGPHAFQELCPEGWEQTSHLMPTPRLPRCAASGGTTQGKSIPNLTPGCTHLPLRPSSSRRHRRAQDGPSRLMARRRWQCRQELAAKQQS